jgi:hypothetical protein
LYTGGSSVVGDQKFMSTRSPENDVHVVERALDTRDQSTAGRRNPIEQ